MVLAPTSIDDEAAMAILEAAEDRLYSFADEAHDELEGESKDQEDEGPFDKAQKLTQGR